MDDEAVPERMKSPDPRGDEQEGTPDSEPTSADRSLRGTLRHYIPDLVYGSNDGIVTTFAVVSGVTGAALSTRIILILGFANLLADGFSMGASNYLSIRSRTAEAGATDRADAVRHAFATFLAFVIAGSIPLAAYIFPSEADSRFPIAVTLTLLSLFGVGAARAFVIEKPWWRSATEMLVVGAAAAAVAYAIGALLALLTGGDAAL